MTKIFRYELRRLLCNKFFLALTAVTLYFAWRTLTGETILGVSYTAPFSAWSFGAYLCSVLPLLLVSLLFFLTFLFSAQEARVRVLTDATPADPIRYLLTRLAALGTGVLLLALGVAALGCAFLWRLFGVSGGLPLLAAAVLALLPPLLLFLGLGAALATLHPAAPYVLMLAAVLLGRAQLLGGTFFYDRPAALAEQGVLDPAFSVPAATLAGAAAMCVLGLALLAVAARRTLKR